MKPHKICAICKHIPDKKFVETLHTDERLPEQVSQLAVIGGYGLYGSEQVRKCPECDTYYSFLHDHDSESGVGFGYTDEAIVRLDFKNALELIESTIKSAHRAIAYWQKEEEEGISKMAPKFTQQHRDELHALEVEKAFLIQKLDKGTSS